MLVDHTPQQVWFATQCDEHLVEVPRVTPACAAPLSPDGQSRCQTSHQHRIVSYVTVTPRSKSSSSMSRKLN
jgi:hypothetical protein